MLPFSRMLHNLYTRAPDEEKAATHHQAAKIIDDIIQTIHEYSSSLTDESTLESRELDELQNLLSGLYTNHNRVTL